MTITVAERFWDVNIPMVPGKILILIVAQQTVRYHIDIG
jgi:hypothetical protein